MKRIFRMLGCAAFALVFMGIGWYLDRLFGPKEAERAAKPPEPPSVAVDEAKTTPFNPADEYVGHVEPVQDVDILPQVEGYITKVAFTEGSEVREGDVLFEIDPEPYLAAMNLRRAEIESAESKALVAAAEVDRAERYLKRLADADSRGITGTELDTAETTLASAKAALASAKAAVEQARAAAAVAEFSLKHVTVKAPMAGRIGKAMKHVGDYVAPNKERLARIVQLDPVRVVFPMTDRDYFRLPRSGGDAPARRLRLRLPDGSVYPENGRFEFADNEMDASTATITVRALFPNAKGALVPATFVRVVSDEENPKEVLSIPSRAVVKTKAGPAALVVGSGSTVTLRLIETGGEWKGSTAVLSGLEAGEKVVSQGVQKVSEGARVVVVPALSGDGNGGGEP